MDQLRRDAETIVLGSIAAMVPELAVARALEGMTFPGDIYLVAVGKAAWAMAKSAITHLPRPATDGIVLTKYGHIPHPLPGIRCLEAGHPIPDENSFRGTKAVLDMVEGLGETDTVLFLLSGGGSALFELPLCAPETLTALTDRLLRAGADILELNTIRKRLSGVKGGRFALRCGKARIESVILSDVLGDPIDMIASGPAAPDSTTAAQALTVAGKYRITEPEILELLAVETPKALPAVRTQVIGSVGRMCQSAVQLAAQLGYEPILLTDRLEGEASEAGRNLARLLASHRSTGRKIALICGGETVVTVRGKGMGGRNQELVLAAAEKLSQIPNACLISLGSDGTDGPTDAAGGCVTTDTLGDFHRAGIDHRTYLEDNDSYHALKAVGSLIFTGPTGTNVNDITIGLLG